MLWILKTAHSTLYNQTPIFCAYITKLVLKSSHFPVFNIYQSLCKPPQNLMV